MELGECFIAFQNKVTNTYVAGYIYLNVALTIKKNSSIVPADNQTTLNCHVLNIVKKNMVVPYSYSKPLCITGLSH